MAKARRRAPGGGRKPAGNIHSKVETFSTRITKETRQALENEKKATGHSISQIAEHLLVLGLRTKRELERDNAIRGLALLIDQLAIAIASQRGGKDPRWRLDPFLFRSLQQAIIGLMDRLAPKGSPLEPPPHLTNGPVTTPQDRAAWALDIVWYLFETAEPGLMDKGPYAFMPTRIRASAKVFASQFAQARRDLSL